ncbi:hypothetical protein QE397_001254 [Rhodococcus sp. SORGH_AS 301]|jgi:hypothetical protein|nr:hypothetical protein [Rhodococcus sp. SORGH_AS_0301]
MNMSECTTVPRFVDPRFVHPTFADADPAVDSYTVVEARP